MATRLDTYYADQYQKIQRSGIQGWGNSILDRMIEKQVNRAPGMRILELGASSGEHLRFVNQEPPWTKYICVDIRPGVSDKNLYLNITKSKNPFRKNVKFIKGDAEDLPFADNTFDLVISTCLLAHVQNPELVLKEARRVVKNGGQIVIGMPCDPGMLNRLIKFFLTYPRMKRVGVENPRLLYAREHKNSINALIEILKHHFEKDFYKLIFFPFRIPSWNLNLMVTVNCNVVKTN
jgi:ubiquinone/menaquinone biosynthesis C-methylase UbiE